MVTAHQIYEALVEASKEDDAYVELGWEEGHMILVDGRFDLTAVAAILNRKQNERR